MLRAYTGLLGLAPCSRPNLQGNLTPDPRLSEWARYASVPPRVNIARECLDNRIAAGDGAKIAFVADSGKLTYTDLDAKVTAFAANLAGMGIGRGDRVLIRMW